MANYCNNVVYVHLNKRKKKLFKWFSPNHFQRIISFPNKMNTVQSIINMIHNLRELRDLFMFYCALHDQAKQKSFFATGLRRPTKQTYLLNSSKDMTIELGPTTEVGV